MKNIAVIATLSLIAALGACAEPEPAEATETAAMDTAAPATTTEPQVEEIEPVDGVTGSNVTFGEDGVDANIDEEGVEARVNEDGVEADIDL